MKYIKLFENFNIVDIFELPIFLEFTPEDDEIFDKIVHPVLKPFQEELFKLGEPSMYYGRDIENPEEIVAEYWLTTESLEELTMVTPHELNVLEKIFPDTYMSESKYPVFFGRFYWYSTPDFSEEADTWPDNGIQKYWIVAKDMDGKYRHIQGERKDLRALWNKAKPWENLEDLLKSEIQSLKEIGPHLDDHLGRQHQIEYLNNPEIFLQYHEKYKALRGF